MDSFNNQDFREIARELEKYEGIFAKLWEIGRPIFDSSIPTACVTFNKVGKFISFHFNPDFWNSLDLKNKCFVICHECTHLILHHGVRMIGFNRTIANTAEDIVINELLVQKMDFNRKDLIKLKTKDGEESDFCWFDTVFSEKNGFSSDFLEGLPKNENFEYYYEILKKQAKEQIEQALKEGRVVLVDGHEGFEGEDMSDILEEAMEGVSTEELESLKKKLNSLNKEENKEFKESEESKEKQNKAKNGQNPGGQQAGTGSGSLVKVIEARKIVKKKKWETIIKKWVKKMMTETEKEVYSFKKKNKRYEYLLNNSNFLLPALLEEDEIDTDKKKIDVICILDSSGSCASLAPRFFYAAESIPENRFNVELACFDTQYYPLNKKDRSLRGFGGTSLSCVSNYIKTNYYDKGKFPYLYVLTDGESYDHMTIEEKQQYKWNFFLTEGGSTHCIPKGCNIYKLADFE